MLRVLWKEALGEIHMHLMGGVQLEVLGSGSWNGSGCGCPLTGKHRLQRDDCRAGSGHRAL